MSDEEDNLDEVVQMIFEDQPKPKGSIQLGLEDTEENTENTNRNIVFEILSQIFIRGIEKMYNTKYVIELSRPQFNKMNEYFSAINYICIVKVNFTNLDPWEAYSQNIHIITYQLSFEILK
jgi:hypothetical protein